MGYVEYVSAKKEYIVLKPERPGTMQHRLHLIDEHDLAPEGGGDIFFDPI